MCFREEKPERQKRITSHPPTPAQKIASYWRKFNGRSEA